MLFPSFLCTNNSVGTVWRVLCNQGAKATPLSWSAILTTERYYYEPGKFLTACGLLGLLQLLVLPPGSSYLYTVLCVPNPSIVLLISLLSKDTVSVHGFLEAPLKV